MDLEGHIRTPSVPPLMARVLRGAIVIAVLGAMLAAGLLAFGLALALIPVVIMAGLVAWGAFRFQMWRRRAAFSAVMPRSPPGGAPTPRDPWR
ncbi:hypothetical protein [Acidisphaera rubrifaciens]|nr:hypothetical protein [Acidisphaera rubrifaciens]